MIHALQAMLAPEAMRRLTLLINHVLSRESVATDRLRPHCGRLIELSFEPADDAALVPLLRQALPLPAPLCLRVTPAGLFEWEPQASQVPHVPSETRHPHEAQEASQAQDSQVPQTVHLQVRVRLQDPISMARLALAGQRPQVEIEGDAALAGDVNWLVTNLRWDIADDVERLLGPAAAQALSQAAQALRGVLQQARDGLGARA